MAQLRVKVVIDTEQLNRWAATHRDMGHQSVAAALSVAANHYANTDADPANPDTDPPTPTYPPGDTVELRTWANWHADHAPAGVAHILYEAAASTSKS